MSSGVRKAVLVVAAALVLWLTRAAPSFAFLGPRGELLGWLGYVTALTAALPAAAALLVVRRPLRACGLSWGRARRDARWIALGLLGAVAVAALLARSPEMRAYYPRYAFVKAEPLLWLPSTLAFAAYGLAWEAMFRGFLLLGLLENPDGELTARAVAGPLFLQTGMFVLGHADKPLLEACLSLPAGLLFGLLALRTRSVLPGFLWHFTLSTSLNLLCAYGAP